MDPCSLLWPKSITTNFDMLPNKVGMVPMNSLLYNSNYLSSTRLLKFGKGNRIDNWLKGTGFEDDANL